MTCHSHDLCESLKMQNNKACYKRMRVEILATAKKHLDPKSSCSTQENAVQALMDELAARWPDFFGGKDDGNIRALKRAIAYIRQQHAATRSRIKSGKGPKVKKIKPTTNPIVPLKQEVLDPPLSSDTQVPLVERMTRNLEYYRNQVPPSTPATSGPTVPITPAPSGPSRTVRPFVELTTPKAGPSTKTTTPLPRRFNTQNSQSSSDPTSSFSYSSSSSSQVSAPQSCPIESKQQATVYYSMPSMSPISHPMNVQSIHQFLRTCLPPMDHFLNRFIYAGLRTEEGLLGVSRWPRELIESFVEQLPPHADGSPVLLMEKMVLLHQFATYFL